MTHFSKSWTKQDEKEYLKIYYQKNKAIIIQRSKDNYYGENHLDNIKKRVDYNKTHKERKNAINRKCHAKRKLRVITFYSQGSVSCASCGITDIRVLSIDHIESNGAVHRKQISGGRLYDWLINNNFPGGHQVLCMNCQFIKRVTHNECRKPVINNE